MGVITTEQADSSSMFEKSKSLLRWSQRDEANVEALRQEARDKFQAEMRDLAKQQAAVDEADEQKATLEEMRRRRDTAIQNRARVPAGEAQPQTRLLLHAPQPAQLAVGMESQLPR